MQNDNYENDDQGYVKDDMNLAQFDEDFDEAEVEERDLEPIPTQIQGLWQFLDRSGFLHFPTTGNA